MVDYSKWDKMALDISDDEDSGGAGKGVSVTRLEGEKGGRVTIGKDGFSISEGSGSGDGHKRSGGAAAGATAKRGGAGPGSGASASSGLQQDMHKLLTENGKDTEEYLWSQTRTDVVLRIRLPADVKGSQLDVQLTDGFLDVKRNGDRIFHKKLRYSVDLTGDEDGVSDWEVMDIPALGRDCRYLCFTLRKMSAIPGATFWWNGVFEGDEEIDVTAIPGRSMAHMDAWQEAQRLFKEKVKQREPISLHFDDDVDEEAKAPAVEEVEVAEEDVGENVDEAEQRS